MVPDPALDAAQHVGAGEVLQSLLYFDPGKYGLPPFPDAASGDDQDSPAAEDAGAAGV